MPTKRVVFREWLIFLGIFFLSPAPMGIYDWINQNWIIPKHWKRVGQLTALEDRSLRLFHPYGESTPPHVKVDKSRKWWEGIPDGEKPGAYQYLAATESEAKLLGELMQLDRNHPKLQGNVMLGRQVVIFAKTVDEAKEIEHLLLTSRHADRNLKGKFFVVPKQFADPVPSRRPPGGNTIQIYKRYMVIPNAPDPQTGDHEPFLIGPTGIEFAEGGKRFTKEELETYTVNLFKDIFADAQKRQVLWPAEYSLLKMAGVALVLEKPEEPSLWEHVISALTKTANYIVIVFTYPLFLFLRSIVWAIRVCLSKKSI